MSSGGFCAPDWEHSLGGMHVLAWESSDLVGHGCVVQRRLLYGGRALRAGYVEAVAVRGDRRRHGVGSSIMDEVRRLVRGTYDLGALSTTDDAMAFYETRGWQRWQGPTSALTPAGVVRTEDDDGGVFVLPVAVALDVTGELCCDWRDGDLW